MRRGPAKSAARDRQATLDHTPKDALGSMIPEEAKIYGQGVLEGARALAKSEGLALDQVAEAIKQRDLPLGVCAYCEAMDEEWIHLAADMVGPWTDKDPELNAIIQASGGKVCKHCAEAFRDNDEKET